MWWEVEKSAGGWILGSAQSILVLSLLVDADWST